MFHGSGSIGVIAGRPQSSTPTTTTVTADDRSARPSPKPIRPVTRIDAAVVHCGRVEQRADVPQRVFQVAVVPAVDQRLTPGGPVQSDDHPHGEVAQLDHGS